MTKDTRNRPLNGGRCAASAAALSVALFTLLAVQSVYAQTFKTIFNFPGGAPGESPEAGLVVDGSGNLYGTTTFGGLGYGLVFKMDALGSETVLYTFTGGADGAFPNADLIRDKAGNLYGTTANGGNPDCDADPPAGCGVIFKLDSTDQETVLHAFAGGTTDGSFPKGVIRDAAGNLYGTTFRGGNETGSLCLPVGCGLVYKLDATGQETVLYTFSGQSDGSTPYASLVLDSAGNLYGTTGFGGVIGGNPCGSFGCGLVFKLDAMGHETVLHSFSGANGKTPEGSLIRDPAGNLYGTTLTGGNKNGSECLQGGCGLVFELDASGRETVLYAFRGQTDGGNPYPDLLRDQVGNLFGTTSAGGDGIGVAFQVSPSGTETVEHTFAEADGAGAEGQLVNSQGLIYGTASGGGAQGFGTVFALQTSPGPAGP